MKAFDAMASTDMACVISMSGISVSGKVFTRVFDGQDH